MIGFYEIYHWFIKNIIRFSVSITDHIKEYSLSSIIWFINKWQRVSLVLSKSIFSLSTSNIGFINEYHWFYKEIALVLSKNIIGLSKSITGLSMINIDFFQCVQCLYEEISLTLSKDINEYSIISLSRNICFINNFIKEYPYIYQWITLAIIWIPTFKFLFYNRIFGGYHMTDNFKL